MGQIQYTDLNSMYLDPLLLCIVDYSCPDPEYEAHVSGGHRAQEAVQLLKEFYNGENPYAPNPKVKGVKVKKDPPPPPPPVELNCQ